MRVQTSQGAYDVSFVAVERVLDGLTEHDRVVIDENVATLWPGLELHSGRTYVVTPGEASKSLDEFGRICSWLATSRASRQTRLYAIGGGVVGDLAGFVAASFMRGIGLVMIPTTLLAMVDSSVGGKVAIDIPEGKNLVGAFWPPVEVRIAVEFLTTLPARELKCGAAEVWKYGWIMDPGLVESLERTPIDQGAELGEIVSRCVALKAQVVQDDEHETTGLRAILNFGHTIGHAIEAELGYEGWSHGEAISVGMVVEAQLGESLGITPEGTSNRIKSGHALQGLPVELPKGVKAERLMEFVRRDKKASSTGLGFSLLTSVGGCKLVEGVSEDHVLRALTES